MKTHYKNNLLAVALIIGASQTSWVSAHDQTGSLLGTVSPGATDMYQVTCSSGGGTYQQEPTAKFQAQIENQSAGPMMSLQIIKGAKAVNILDDIGGDGFFGPVVSLTPPVGSGGGVYTILVNHTGQASQQYRFIYFCLSSSNNITGTSILRLQNQ